MTKRVSIDKLLASATAKGLPVDVIRPFEHSLPMQLMRAREAVMRRFRPMLRANGFTDQQWRVVRVLAESDELELTDLARRCLITPPSLSRIVPRLEEAGIIRRRAHKTDQRRVTVQLTGEGKAVFSKVAAASEVIYRDIAQSMGRDTLNELYDALDAMIEKLDGGEITAAEED